MGTASTQTGRNTRGAERPFQIPKIQEHALTLTLVFNFFIAWFALALSDWHHPLPIDSAVDARQLLADGVLHAHPAHFPQRLVLTSGHGLGERSKTLDCGRASFIVDPDGEKSDAGSDVLKGQVEAFPRQVLHHFRLGVDAQLVFAGDLVRRDGGHFLKLALAEGGAHVRVRLGREEVESFFAGQRGTVERVAVTYDELELHEDPRSRQTALDEGGAKPVVLFTLSDVADREGVELRAIQGSLDDLPLKQNHTKQQG